jgi:TorA maturation chaperone TorD
MREKGNAESVRFINLCALHVAELYKKSGFVASKKYREPEDHIATELEYLYLLHVRMAQALATNDDAVFDSSRELLTRFRSTHASKWFRHFYQEVVAIGNDSPYAVFARFGLLVE